MLYDMFVKIENFIFLIYFVILYCEVDFEVPIIFGILLLATIRVLVDIEYYELKIRMNNKEVNFNIS